ncbi:MYG1 family protein [Leuconostoc mesenteroides]|uniref:MYG1 family protein n=1 Tax=Leuconostoc mesenteroides TaxID=1245 RepID=UPI00119FAF5D|nr:MYG1 family protein [Leuconostoc mesenteroides]
MVIDVNKELANEVFEAIYTDFSGEIDKQTKKLCSELGRLNNKEYNDFEDTKNLIISELFNRLSHAKVSTLQRYSNDKDAQKKLIAQVRKEVKDKENNGTKIYTTERQNVEQYNWKTDETTIEYKQVRVYQPQVSFDRQESSDESGYSYSLSDALSIDDIRIPDMRKLQKGNVVQVLRNVQLFSKSSQAFVMMLFTQGESETKRLLGMTNSNFNQKIERLESWIQKHSAFKDILTGEEQEHLESLRDMAHFENLLSITEQSQVQKWLKANIDKSWIQYILNERVDNDVLAIESWDIEGQRKNSYQFINAMHELQEMYQDEVMRAK